MKRAIMITLIGVAAFTQSCDKTTTCPVFDIEKPVMDFHPFPELNWKYVYIDQDSIEYTFVEDKNRRSESYSVRDNGYETRCEAEIDSRYWCQSLTSSLGCVANYSTPDEQFEGRLTISSGSSGILTHNDFGTLTEPAPDNIASLSFIDSVNLNGQIYYGVYEIVYSLVLQADLKRVYIKKGQGMIGFERFSDVYTFSHTE